MAHTFEMTSTRLGGSELCNEPDGFDIPDPFDEFDPSGVIPAAAPLDPACLVEPADLLDPFDLLDPSDMGDSSDSRHVPSALDAMYEYAATTEPFGEFAALTAALDDAEAAQFTANRAMAAHLDAVRRALEIARRHPALYLHAGAAMSRDAEDLAVRAAAAELSMRLQIPAGTVRNRAHEADILQERLPRVWARFTNGIAGYADVRAAADAASAFETGDARLDEFDHSLAELIGTSTSSRFRQRVRTLRAKLDRATLEARHTREFAARRVIVEHVDDGMSWVHLFVSSVDAARIQARLDATALSMSGAADEPRTLDQLRADTAIAWLTGEGTPTAATAEVIVTVPLFTITGKSGEPGHLDGVGPIDPATARQLFADAPSFLRLAVDPITSAPLDLDRTRYRPTKAQRRWLALRYGRCTRPGCNRLAVASDIDHVQDWFFHGPSNIANLAPTCRGDHRLKHTARFTVAKRTDGTMTWRSPTGRTYANPPPF
ncbi:DUF222 domain-containing protein [Agromyces sp. NPDC058484]|uniref:HNH endonuclease signature motif containing protein n=1 Tax=Agromyces sp. NPDC058484 TaxID=3346524 RepID=UPI003661A699